MSSSPTQVPIYCPHVLQDFLNFRLVVFVPIFIICIPSPNSAVQQLCHILPYFIPYFCMYCYQVIFSIFSMQINYQLLLLHPLLLHNGMFSTSPTSNIVGCLIYLWHLRKGWINTILAFFLSVIHCLLLFRTSYSFILWIHY